MLDNTINISGEGNSDGNGTKQEYKGMLVN